MKNKLRNSNRWASVPGSTHGFRRATGINQETIIRVLTEAGQKRGPDKVWVDPAACLQVLEAYKQERRKRRARGIDPATGLTWLEASLREKTLRERRENKAEERLLRETYMNVSDHRAIMGIIAKCLRTVPNILKARLGLTREQQATIERAIEDAMSAGLEDAKTAAPDAPAVD